MSSRLTLDGDPFHIRLLDIEHSNTQKRDEDDVHHIRGTLRVVSLSSSPKYAALSYTWGGDPSPAYIVECGSDRIQVTKSCIDALLQISARGDKMSIWVDAISIDQKNEKEKNHQVGIMNEIYSHAKTVYVWLGSSTEDSDKAIEHLTDLGSEMRCLEGLSCIHSRSVFSLRVLADFWTNIIFRDLSSFLRRLTLRMRLSSTCNTPTHLATINGFLELEYFNRGWTFQELILANKPILLCGSNSLDWNRFICGVARLFLYTLEDPNYFRPKCPIIYSIMSLTYLWMTLDRPIERSGQRPWGAGDLRSSYLAHLREFERFYKSHSSKVASMKTWLVIIPFAAGLFSRNLLLFISGLSLLVFFEILVWIACRLTNSSYTTLEAFDTVFANDPRTAYHQTGHSGILKALRQRKTKDSRDKSYALYGVLKAMGLSLKEADYSKTHAQVYRELFLDLLSWNPKSLDLILDAGLPRMEGGAPTWIPQWHLTEDHRWLDMDFLLGDHRTLLNDHRYGIQNKEYGQRYFIPPTHDGDPKLRVRGRTRDRVVYCSLLSSMSSDLDFIRSMRIWLSAIAQRTAPKVWHLSELQRGIYYFLTLDQNKRSAVYHPKWRRKMGSCAPSDPLPHAFEKWFDIMLRATNVPVYDPDLDTHSEGHPAYGLSTDQSLLDAVLSETAAATFHRTARELLSTDRTLYVTRRGHFGTGPEYMQGTDCIYRLEGFAADVVLREVVVHDREEEEVEVAERECLLVGPALTCYNSRRWKNLKKYQGGYYESISIV